MGRAADGNASDVGTCRFGRSLVADLSGLRCSILQLESIRGCRPISRHRDLRGRQSPEERAKSVYGFLGNAGSLLLAVLLSVRCPSYGGYRIAISSAVDRCWQSHRVSWFEQPGDQHRPAKRAFDRLDESVPSSIAVPSSHETSHTLAAERACNPGAFVAARGLLPNRMMTGDAIDGASQSWKCEDQKQC